MNAPDPEKPLDRFHRLMTGALDDQLTAAEQAEFEQLLAASPERRREWNDYKRLKEMTTLMKYPDPPHEVWTHYWTGIYNRIERRLAWILVSIGAMILLFYAGYQAIDSILADPKLPWVIKAAILALMAGGIVLFVSVLREKLFTWKTDKYKEIEQ